MSQDIIKEEFQKAFYKLHQIICSECYELIGFSAEKITGYIHCMKCRRILNQGLEETL